MNNKASSTTSAVTGSTTATFQAKLELELGAGAGAGAVPQAHEKALEAYAIHFSKVEHALLKHRAVSLKRSDVADGSKEAIMGPYLSLKQEFCRKYGLTARQFNAVNMQLSGKVDAALELVKLHLKEKEELIDKLSKKHKKIFQSIEKNNTTLNKLIKTQVNERQKLTQTSKLSTKKIMALTKSHEKSYKEIEALKKELRTQRKERHYLEHRISHLKNKQADLQAQLDTGVPSLCFGSKDLLKKQRTLLKRLDLLEKLVNQGPPRKIIFEEIKALTQQLKQWKVQWETARSGQFYVLGSKDETAGNQGCVATITEIVRDPDELGRVKKISLRLSVRLPDALINSQHAERKSACRSIVIPNVSFEYSNSAQEIYEALTAPGGQALSYRFIKSINFNHETGEPTIAFGWHVHVTTARKDRLDWSKFRALKAMVGAVGVDVNPDHLAVAELDCHGNIVNVFNIPLNLYGKSAHQRTALIQAAVLELIKYCHSVGKPLIHENLDFAARKNRLGLRDQPPRYERMLSSFAYAEIIKTIQSMGLNYRVFTQGVNPAFTSVIGRVKYMRRYGLTIDQSAAMVIGRRGLGFKELQHFPLWDLRMPACLFLDRNKQVALFALTNLKRSVMCMNGRTGEVCLRKLKVRLRRNVFNKSY